MPRDPGIHGSRDPKGHGGPKRPREAGRAKRVHEQVTIHAHPHEADDSPTDLSVSSRRPSSCSADILIHKRGIDGRAKRTSQ